MNEQLTIKDKIIGVLTIIIIVLLLFLFQQPKIKKEIKFIPTKEIVYLDSIRIEKKTKIISQKDTFIYVNKETITDTINDTIQIPIKIDFKTYLDTIRTDTSSTIINIDYSGYMAKINNINLQHNYFNKQTTIIKQNKFGFGFQIGFGVGYDLIKQDFGIGPYIGCGISYNF